jgi:hypothetical protein
MFTRTDAVRAFITPEVCARFGPDINEWHALHGDFAYTQHVAISAWPKPGSRELALLLEFVDRVDWDGFWACVATDQAEKFNDSQTKFDAKVIMVCATHFLAEAYGIDDEAGCLIHCKPGGSAHVDIRNLSTLEQWLFEFLTEKGGFTLLRATLADVKVA